MWSFHCSDVSSRIDWGAWTTGIPSSRNVGAEIFRRFLRETLKRWAYDGTEADRIVGEPREHRSEHHYQNLLLETTFPKRPVRRLDWESLSRIFRRCHHRRRRRRWRIHSRYPARGQPTAHFGKRTLIAIGVAVRERTFPNFLPSEVSWPLGLFIGKFVYPN